MWRLMRYHRGTMQPICLGVSTAPPAAVGNSVWEPYLGTPDKNPTSGAIGAVAGLCCCYPLGWYGLGPPEVGSCEQ